MTTLIPSRSGRAARRPRPSPRAPRHRGGDPHRKPDAPGVAAWRERMGTDAAKVIYRLRTATVEWTNALARNRDLGQFRVRGLARVHSVLLWYALAPRSHSDHLPAGHRGRLTHRIDRAGTGDPLELFHRGLVRPVPGSPWPAGTSDAHPTRARSRYTAGLKRNGSPRLSGRSHWPSTRVSTALDKKTQVCENGSPRLTGQKPRRVRRSWPASSRA
jgi:Transposase DDE domain